ncbi:MAG TPA: sodium-transporting two-sector ATPase [Candidatus Saccharimonadales bacterium]|nr:sodium-transporting two-sector ATPase [Candidatus Saccharimonadales bacterium]
MSEATKTSTGLHFDSLVKSGNPVGEVIGVNKFLVKLSGMQPCNIHSLIMFEDGSKGIIHQIFDDYVVALHLGNTTLQTGLVAVIQHQELVSKVGKDYIGRVISVTGDPLDGKGPIATDAVWPVFNAAPPLHSRKLLDTQLESGVTVIDALFPVVRGQRLAVLGDSKSGKSSLVTQLTTNQKNTDQVVVYALIAKRRSDVDTLLTRLKENGGLEKAIVVVSTMFESLILSYLAPYVACALAEYLWQTCNQDTIIIYDDLTSHAHAYREIALLSGISPGRDSYPGDMFYAHSSLLERAGRISKNGKHLTSIPVVLAAGGDITAYLPTNIMSITDGQWILDMETFRKGIRPAVSMGLSVTRVGGVGHNKRQKALAAKALKVLAEYRQAEEFSHFGTELAEEAKKSFQTGLNILEIINQQPSETYSLMAQQLMLDIILNHGEGQKLDIPGLKLNVKQYGEMVKTDADYEQVKAELLEKSLITKPKSESEEPTKGPAEESEANVSSGTIIKPDEVKEEPKARDHEDAKAK